MIYLPDCSPSKRSNLDIRPENVFVNVLESAPENWSVGHGLAQFA